MASNEPRTPERGSSSKATPSPPTREIASLKVDKMRSRRGKSAAAYSAMNFEDPIPENVRARVPSLVQAREAFRDEEIKRKRDVSDSSVESVCDRYVKRQQSGKSVQEFNNEYEEKVKNRINARIRLTELHLTQRNEELKRLTDDQRKLKRNQFITARDALEGQMEAIRNEWIALQRQKHQIKGRLIDFRHQYQLVKDLDLAVDQLMDLMVAKYDTVPGGHSVYPEAYLKGPRGSTDQTNFRRRLVQYYDAQKGIHGEENEEMRSLWCPISRRYHLSSSIQAAHIVPHAIGETNCIYLFAAEETGTGHLMSAKNGILMHYLFERAMDRAQIAIVPANEEKPSAEELKVVVFDQNVLKNDIPGFDFSWKDLQGHRLEFKNKNRPGLRYLYFTFLMTLFRRRRYECTGWRSDLKRYGGREMWGSPDKWLRGSSLRALARRVGHESSLENFLGTPNLPLDTGIIADFDDTLIAEEVFAAYTAKHSKESKDSEQVDEEQEIED